MHIRNLNKDVQIGLCDYGSYKIWVCHSNLIIIQENVQLNTVLSIREI